jgi:hypothetical protein
MKKTLLTGIAVLFLATGMAHAVAAEIIISGGKSEEVGSGKILPTHFIQVKGEINKGDADAFRPEAFSKIQLHKHVFVVLESNGGVAMEALNIGTAIRKMDFDTVVFDNKTCASACALIWLAGHYRWAGPKASIGFHAIYYGEGNVSSGGNALVGAYLRELGLSLKAIRYLTQAPPDGMEWLSIESAYKYDIKLQVYKEPEKYE